MIENTGKRNGAEVAQVYVQLPNSSGENFRRLAGWQRVELAAGERKTVHVELEPLALQTFDEAKDAWQRLPGEYVVSVGGSSRDLTLHESVKLK